MKPMLASDYDESKLRFPVLVQPKIDGVRGLNLEGALTGRSLKEHANRYTTALYTRPEFVGFDGELAAAHETDGDLCRKTTSALNTIAGEPYTLWHLFDFVVPQTMEMTYWERYGALSNYVHYVLAPELRTHLRIVPAFWAHNLEELLYHDNNFLDDGYEGTILRDPSGLYKQGRSTVREGGLLRIKRFTEEEARVDAVIEGETNTNEAQVNELGAQFRSSHKEGMVPNGKVGALRCTALKTGEEIIVSAGKLTAQEREHYFQRQDLIVGKVIKYKFFPKGIKDKPRFPTFQSFRMASDIGDMA